VDEKIGKNDESQTWIIKEIDELTVCVFTCSGRNIDRFGKTVTIVNAEESVNLSSDVGIKSVFFLIAF